MTQDFAPGSGTNGLHLVNRYDQDRSGLEGGDHAHSRRGRALSPKDDVPRGGCAVGVISTSDGAAPEYETQQWSVRANPPARSPGRVCARPRAMGYRTIAVYRCRTTTPRTCASPTIACCARPDPRWVDGSYLSIRPILEAATNRAPARSIRLRITIRNEAFATACEEGRLGVIGPRPAAIAAMGQQGPQPRGA